MLRTAHSKPQVNVYINWIPSKCSGSCDFEWDQGVLPEVNSIDVSSLPDIIITGTRFDSYDLSKNTVALGNYTCFVKNVSETEIICCVGEIP